PLCALRVSVVNSFRRPFLLHSAGEPRHCPIKEPAMKTAAMVRCAAVVALCAGAASAQVELYAVSFAGNLFRLNTTTGAATLIGATGTDRLNSAAANS